MERVGNLFSGGAGFAYRGCRKIIKAKAKGAAHLAVVVGTPEEHITVDVDVDMIVQRDQQPAGSYNNVGDENGRTDDHQLVDTLGCIAGGNVVVAKGNDMGTMVEYMCTANEQQLLAHLIEGVYSRDRGAKDFPLGFMECGYKEDMKTEAYTKLWTRMEDIALEEEKKNGLKHYLWPSSTDQTSSSPSNLRRCKNSLPYRLVIALRGTKLSSFRDLRDDFKVAHHTLHCSRRFKDTNKLIEQIISVFKEQHGGKDDEVCITGHSLGAAIALFIGKELAKEKRYHVHCFNPPLLSVVMFIQKFFPVHIIKEKLWGNEVLTPLLRAAHYAKDTSKIALMMVLGDRDKLREEFNHFAGIVDWQPVFYVNQDDLICREYHRLYEWKQKNFCWPPVLPIDTQAMLSRIIRKNAKYSSLVPSLQMNICMSPRIKNKKTIPNRSHAITQWFNVVPLETKVFQLLGPTLLPLDDPLFVKIMQDALRQAVENTGTTTSPQSTQMTTALGRLIGPAALGSLHHQQADHDSDDEELRTKEDSDDAELSGEDLDDME
jgi:hypothetical protein